MLNGGRNRRPGRFCRPRTSATANRTPPTPLRVRLRRSASKPLDHFQQFLRRRGMVIFISDFYDSPEHIVRTIEPLRFHGNEVVLFHVLDPKEIRPEFREPTTLVDLETQDRIEITPEYVRDEYQKKFDAHVEALRDKTKGAGMDPRQTAAADGGRHQGGSAAAAQPAIRVAPLWPRAAGWRFGEGNPGPAAESTG